MSNFILLFCFLGINVMKLILIDWENRYLSWLSAGLLIVRLRVRISPGARCCVLEQDTSSSLLNTGSTKKKRPDMTEKLLTGT